VKRGRRRRGGEDGEPRRGTREKVKKRRMLSWGRTEVQKEEVRLQAMGENVTGTRERREDYTRGNKRRAAGYGSWDPGNGSLEY